MAKKKAKKENKVKKVLDRPDDKKENDKKYVGIKGDYKRNREVYWALGFMIILVVFFFVSKAVIGSFFEFEYQGLKFTKEKFGDIPVYHHFYYYDNPEGQRIQYNLYLRGDPRENTVPFSGNIRYKTNELVYISVNGTGISSCEYASVGVGSLAAFLTDNSIDIKGATPDNLDAEKNNLTFADCNSKDELVIMIQSGEETKIRARDKCHVIEINSCEILQAVEKYEVEAILDARERAKLGVR